MKCRNLFICWSSAFVLAMSLISCASFAEQRAYSEKGADTCLKCHDEDNEYPVLPIFKSYHATLQDQRTPMAQMQCESCHGPLGRHDKKADTEAERVRMFDFGKKAKSPIHEQNSKCLACHQDQRRHLWSGSKHQTSQVSCADCHRIHAERDTMRDALQQKNTCFSCHEQQRGQFQQTSAHPVRNGGLSCSQCHNPHGSVSAGLLNRSSINQLCFDCHGEKRGPFLWPHAPVAEDCTLCHTPHGSAHRPMLKTRAPFICQQCHSFAGHPSAELGPSGLTTANRQSLLLGKSCLNCHAMIHGSNHPSGVRFIR